MVPDPSLSRRGLLAGLGGLTAGGTLAVGASAPTLLPDALTDWATRAYPTPPEVTAHWRPTVTESHARWAVEYLADTVATADRRWADLDEDAEHGHYHGAGGWLEDAREELNNGKYHEALYSATYGMQFAAEGLGSARARQDDADPVSLAEAATDLVERTREQLAALRPYPVADAGLDLAWYWRIERELEIAANEADWGQREATLDGVGDENGPSADLYDPHTVGSLTAGLRTARIRRRNAAQFASHLRDRLDGRSTTPAESHLREVAEAFRAAVEREPSTEEIRERYVVGVEEYGPYEFAHTRLLRMCDEPYVPFTDLETVVRPAVGHARALAGRRAHETAVDRLVVDPDDAGFDSGHTLAAKRRARATYRRVVGSSPPAVLTRLARRAIEDLQVAKVGFVDGLERPYWRGRLKAYCYALAGGAKLGAYPPVYRRLTAVGDDAGQPTRDS